MRDFVYIQDCVAFQYNLFVNYQEIGSFSGRDAYSRKEPNVQGKYGYYGRVSKLVIFFFLDIF